LGAINPHMGTQIRVKSISTQGSFMLLEVRPAEQVGDAALLTSSLSSEYVEMEAPG